MTNATTPLFSEDDTKDTSTDVSSPMGDVPSSIDDVLSILKALGWDCNDGCHDYDERKCARIQIGFITQQYAKKQRRAPLFPPQAQWHNMTNAFRCQCRCHE